MHIFKVQLMLVTILKRFTYRRWWSHEFNFPLVLFDFAHFLFILAVSTVHSSIMSLVKKSSQESDIKFPNPPSEISSLALNGYNNTNTTMCIATSWDGSVNGHLIALIGHLLVFNRSLSSFHIACSFRWTATSFSTIRSCRELCPRRRSNTTALYSAATLVR